MDLRAYIRDIPDFPEPGIVFRDVTPLLADPAAFTVAVDRLVEAAPPADVVVAIEARGFLFGAPVAHRLGTGLVPVRKPGKLPWRTTSVAYELEYGTDALEVHHDGLAPGQRVLVVDDVLATGGTARATCELVEAVGARVAGVVVLVELGFLGGRARLSDHAVASVVRYD